MKGFIEFIREQGVVGLAVGFILGGAVSKVVQAIVTDLVSPLVSVVVGSATDLASASSTVASVKFMWGDFLSAVINFIIVAAVVYFGFKMLRLEKLDRKKLP